MPSVTLVSVQEDVVFRDPAANLARIESIVADGPPADLWLFPECFLTGYVAESEEEAWDMALPYTLGADHESGHMDGALNRLVDLAVQHETCLVVGFAGRRIDLPSSVALRNAAILTRPDGMAFGYEKAVLPHLGFDRFANHGAHLPVFETPFGKVGIFICFDLRPPEIARILAMKGADLLLLPTNWPSATRIPWATLAPARAAENKAFLLTCNRVGEERGTTFGGRSALHGITGEVLASLGEAPGTLRYEIDVESARDKRNVTIPGLYETETFPDHTPGLYDFLSTYPGDPR